MLQIDPELETIDLEEAAGQIPESEGSIVWHLLSQLRFGMSLSRVTLPTFILETRSTIQRLTDWMAHEGFLRLIPLEQDPYLRCLHLCTWIVSGFHLGPRIPKKPYNSLLGECFRCVLTDDENSILGTYIAEQVSHHPPVSAVYFSDRQSGVSIWGHTEMRSKFFGNSMAAQMDHDGTKINLEVHNLHEHYEFNLPDMIGRGFLIGKLVMEIGGSVKIVCPETGITAKINFYEKPLFRGRYNCFSGQIFGPSTHSKKNEAKLEFSGRWSSYMKVTDLREKPKKEWISFDVRSAKILKIMTPPIEVQNYYESQRAWQMVTNYMTLGNTKSATEHKLALEEKQRKERAYFEKEELEWTPQAFHWDEQADRWVPNHLDLSPLAENEVVQMPPIFEYPRLIQQAEENGIVKPMEITQREAEERVQEKERIQKAKTAKKGKK